MKFILDKLRYVLGKEKKFILFICGLALIGFISGTVFTTILSSADKKLVINYISDFINQIRNEQLDFLDMFKNVFVSNVIFLLFMWIVGISIVGIPINIFLYFTKFFVFGFSVSSFILKYGIKGCLFSFIYVFPHQIINLFVFTVLLLFSSNFSKKIIFLLKSKKSLCFQKLFKQYGAIFIVCIFLNFITSIMESLLMPFLLKKILFIIK